MSKIIRSRVRYKVNPFFEPMKICPFKNPNNATKKKSQNLRRELLRKEKIIEEKKRFNYRLPRLLWRYLISTNTYLMCTTK